jgi:hypothetical protein
LSKKATQGISIILFAVSLGVFTWNLDKIYTASSFGLFALLMLFQMLFQWKYARRFYLSFIVIYIPFFL